MEWLIVAVVGLALTVVALSVEIASQKKRRKVVENERDTYSEHYQDALDLVYEGDRTRAELRKVLATAILAKANYLAVDPESFDALPPVFSIYKTSDTGADGDHAIFVYQGGPVSVGG